MSDLVWLRPSVLADLSAQNATAMATSDPAWRALEERVGELRPTPALQRQARMGYVDVSGGRQTVRLPGGRRGGGQVVACDARGSHGVAAERTQGPARSDSRAGAYRDRGEGVAVLTSRA
jgi:hypothetical protein